MAIRKRRDEKRRGRSDARRRGDPATDGDDDCVDRRDESTRPDDDELASRLDAVSARYRSAPTPEELRAAFARKPAEPPPEAPRRDFATSYPADSLFVPTLDDPIDIPTEAEDRSRSRGDYYYDPDDAWSVLGVSPGAQWAEIAAAHRRLAKVHHPDRLSGASEDERATSEEAMREINVAYSVLRRLTGN